MTVSLAFFLLSLTGCVAFLWLYVRPTFSLSSITLGFLVFFHGPAYVYYTRQWSLGEGWAFNLYNQASSRREVIEEVHESATYYDRLLAAIKSPDVIQSLDIALGLTLLLCCAGIWLADKLLRNDPIAQYKASLTWRGAPFLPLGQAQAARILVAASVAVVFMLYFMFQDHQLSKVFNYFFTSAGEFQKIAMRRESGGSPSYLFNLMLGTILPFIAFMLWAWWRERGGMGGVLPWFTVLVIILVFTAKLATLSKAPAAIFVLQLLVLEMARRSLVFSFRHLMLLSITGLSLFALMAFVANSDLLGAKDALMFLFYRIFMIPNVSLIEYFATIPSQLPYTNGNDIRWLAMLFGHEPLQPNYWRVAEFMRGAPGSTTTAMFMADAWAAFSWPGVAAVALALGFIVRWIDRQLIVDRGRSCVTLAGLGLGLHGIFIAISTAFQTALLTGGLLLIVPAVAFFEWRWRKPASAQAPHSQMQT